MNEPSRILVVRTDRLGDVVLTLPVFNALRRRFPAARLVLLAGRYAGEIAEGYGPLDEIFWYDSAAGIVPFFAMRALLKSAHFDAAVIVHPTLRLAMLAFFSRIPLRIGTAYRYYSFLFNRRVFAHRKTAERHEVEYNMDLLGPLGCAGAPGRPLDVPIQIPEEARRRAGSVLQDAGVAGRYVVVHPGSGGSAREWPQENFGRLALRMLERMNVAVVVTGTSGESPLAESVCRAAGGRAVNLSGKLSLKELAALLERASLLVAHSTGPLHVGVALGTPVVGLYPQIPVMGPVRWGPYTDRARVLVPDRPPDCTECAGKPAPSCACMASISVESVYAAAGDLLAETALTEKHHADET